MTLIGVLIGFALGALAAWLLARARARAELIRLETELAHERANGPQLDLQFKSLTDSTVNSAVKAATDRIGEAVRPIEKALENVHREVTALEHSRREDYGSLTSGLTALTQTTGSLATALRSPNVRGQWGELQLRNVVEAAGMLNRCDFLEQESVTTDDGRSRPDAIVKLPGGRQVVIDAKTSFHALLDAEASTVESERERHLDSYTRHIRDHVARLSQKAYWQQFDQTPDFVVMFIPSESFYRTAIERDPHLMELAPGQRVHIASPVTLITMLRAIAVGWRESDVADNAREIEQLGRELYKRLATMTDHYTTLGKRLDGAVQAYNDSARSFESRVLVSARRFVERGVGTDRTLDPLQAIETTAQPPQTVELPVRTADAA